MSSSSSGLSVSKSIGPQGHWGFSAAFDVLEALSHSIAEGRSDSDAIKVLLVEPNDIRHVLCTISRLHRHFPSLEICPPVHFYLLERSNEVLARDLVLLQLAADWEVPVRQRSTIFLEVYGNAFVQRRTSAYLETLSERLLDLLLRGRGSLKSVIDFERVSFRDRDALEDVFKMYSRSVAFDMAKYIDHRRRALYEERYDARKAVQDWDYHSSLRGTASIVHIKQYKHWRETGVAYEFGDQQYTEANKTLLGYVEGTMKSGRHRGERKDVQGFWGDIVVSPFIGLGIDADTHNKLAEDLFEILNKNTGTEQHRHHAVEVALYNLFSYLWETETGQRYEMKKAHDVFSGLGAEAAMKLRNLEASETPISDEKEEKKEEDFEQQTVDALHDREMKTTEPVIDEGDDAIEKELARLLQKADCIAGTLSKVKVIPMSGDPSSALNRLNEKFDFVFVSSRCAQIVGEDSFSRLLREDKQSMLAVESAKFIVPMNKSQKTQFNQKIASMASTAGLSPLVDAPVFRRRRDEKDLEDDVLFFTR